jgi:hypothetical protein
MGSMVNGVLVLLFGGDIVKHEIWFIVVQTRMAWLVVLEILTTNFEFSHTIRRAGSQ